MLRNKAAGAAILLLAGASVAIACGPFFPWQLLDVRSDTLTETPHNSFVFEASHLVPAPSENLKTDEQEYVDNDQLAIEKHTAELKGLSSEEASRISVMRDGNDTDAGAYAAGEGLPDASI